MSTPITPLVPTLSEVSSSTPWPPEEERSQAVRAWVLCFHKKHGLERAPDFAVFDCTFNEALELCKASNTNRKRGSRLCVVPLEKVPPEDQGLSHSVLTHQDLLAMHYGSKISQRREGEIYLSLRRRMLKPRDALSVVKLCQLERGFDLLGLTENSLSDEGLCTIADHLPKSLSHIRGLFVSDNQITAHGVEHLVCVLPKSSIERLGLNFNHGISCRGALALSGPIAAGVLTVLGLTGCGVEDTGCEAIADAVGDHRCRLQRLFLNRNSITNSGADALADKLYNNRSLRRLGLAQNKISCSLSLLAALERNTEIERLCLFGNVFPKQEMLILEKNSRVNLSSINHRR